LLDVDWGLVCSWGGAVSEVAPSARVSRRRLIDRWDNEEYQSKLKDMVSLILAAVFQGLAADNTPACETVVMFVVYANVPRMDPVSHAPRGWAFHRQ
jgi:hypothetical protein